MCYIVLKYFGNFRIWKNKYLIVVCVFLNFIVFLMKCLLCFLEVKWMVCVLLFLIFRKSCNFLRKEIFIIFVYLYFCEFVLLCREKYKILFVVLLFFFSWNFFWCECECFGLVEFCFVIKVWRILYMIIYDWDKYWLWLV